MGEPSGHPAAGVLQPQVGGTPRTGCLHSLGVVATSMADDAHAASLPTLPCSLNMKNIKAVGFDMVS